MKSGDKMNYNLEMPSDVRYIIKVLKNNGYEGYMVGGCVRDLLLNKVPNDYDITTDAQPLVVAELFEKVILTGIKHGTVTIILNNNHYEVTTYRQDGEYKDNRRPEKVNFVTSIKDDLSRRDFTINSMAYNEESGLIDYFNGINDLNNKIIRTVGDPVKRFNEDGLRMLRAVRFSVQLGFKIHDSAVEAIILLNKNIKNISKERIREEFNKIIIKDPRGIDILYKCNLLKYISEDLEKAHEFNLNNSKGRDNLYEHCISAACNVNNDLTLRLAALFHDLGKLKTGSNDFINIDKLNEISKNSAEMCEKILRNLKYDNDTINNVRLLVSYHNYELESKISIKRLLSIIGCDLFEKLIILMKAVISAENSSSKNNKIAAIDNIEKEYKEIIYNKECFTLKELNIDGKEISDIGVQQGKKVGIMLNYLLDNVMKNNELNSKEILIRMVKEKLNEQENV